MTASSVLVEPAFLTRPKFRDTLGPEVADICRMAGFSPDPEQELALDALFAFGPTGKVAAFEFALICSRQNMKTGLFKMAALGWLFVTEQRLIVWSAHEMKTTKEAFRDLENLITGCPALAARLAPGPSHGIHSGNGDEAIELASGQRVMFKARTNGGGRGLSGDKVILDEAFALKPSHMGSLLPTLSARPDPQVVYGSSAGLVESDVLRSIRDRGRPGGDPSLAYIEWCAPADGCLSNRCDHRLDAEGCALDVVDNWQRANPALGRRITVEYVAAERRALPPAEFARERLGWWDEAADAISVIPVGVWAKLADGHPVPAPHVGQIRLAVDSDPQRTRTSISVCGSRADGLPLVEVVENREGVEWAQTRIPEMLANNPDIVAVIIDKRSAAATLIGPLQELNLPVETTDAATMARACGGFFDAAVESEQLRHLDQPILNDALRAAAIRPLGDAWAWDRKKPTADITPLTSATLAHWAWSNDIGIPKNAGRGRVIALN